MNRRLVLGSVALLGLAAALFGARRCAPPPTPSAAPLDARPSIQPRGPEGAPVAQAHAAEPLRPTTTGQGDAGAREDLRQIRRARAEATLQNYLTATRYPPDARPLEERPDLARPHQVPTRRLPLANAEKAAGKARVTLKQDRYYATADERITMTIGCESEGGPTPCEVLSSAAMPPPDMPASATMSPVPVPFTDDGQGGDEAPGDGIFTGSLKPGTQGFSAYHGPIRVEVALRIGGESGTASFDLEYTPAAPATFTGAVREAMVAGSLELYVGLSVKRAGRYILRARVDDAEGRAFAFLSFNDLLPGGAREATLRIFGKLVLDAHAKAPFQLHDLEGYLLEEDAYPDRETIPAKDGLIYTTQRHAEGEFSAAEWESEEKARHVREFTLDVERAMEN